MNAGGNPCSFQLKAHRFDHRGGFRLAQAQRQQQYDHRGNARAPEHRAQFHAQRQQACGDQRSDHRAGVVHRPMQAERESSLLRRDAATEHGIARRTAQSLADAIGEPAREHHPPARRRRDQGACDAGDAIPGHHEGFCPPHPVRPRTRDQLQQAAHRFGDAFDQPQHPRPGAKRADEEQRQQRIDHLAGAVVQQADRAEQPHAARQRTHARDQGRHAVAIRAPPHTSSNPNANATNGCSRN